MPRAPTFNSMGLIKTVIRTGSGSNRYWSLADRLRQGDAGCMDLSKAVLRVISIEALIVRLYSPAHWRIYSFIPSQLRRVTCTTFAA